MRRSELEALFSQSGQQLMRKLSPELDMSDILKLVSALRQEGYAAEVVAAVLGQLQLRRRARKKLGPIADRLFYTEPGLEQATRLAVAAQHAERFRAAGCERIADLGCGIGIDSSAFAALNLQVTAVERDEVTAAVAAYNLAAFPRVQVIHGEAESVSLKDVDGIWFDPARRELQGANSGTRKRLDPSQFTPHLEFVFTTLRQLGGGVKLGPDFPLELIPEDCEAEWVSHEGELVELVLWFGKLALQPGGRVALLVSGDGVLRFSGSGSQLEAAENLGRYIFEPNPALIRSELVGDFAAAAGLRPTAARIAYLTGDIALKSPWLKTYEVFELLTLDTAKLRSRLAELGIGVLEIKKRGVDIEPEQLRQKLKLKGKGAATLILTRVGDARLALLCQPLR
jgi:SAM-dependent methyltransferase